MNLGDYGLTDYTPLMSLYPRKQNLLEELGFFTEANTDYLDSEWFTMEREYKGLTKMSHVARDADRNFLGSEDAIMKQLQVPFAALDSVTKPQEVNAFREFGTENETASIGKLVDRKMSQIQRSHADLIRSSQYGALVNNKVYAVKPDGSEWTSLSTNFSTLWDAPRQTGSVDLTDDATNPFDALTAARAAVIAYAGDNSDSYDMGVICNTAQFDAIVTHPLVEDAYSSYSSEQEPLRKRLSGNRNNRTFRHLGLVILEDISGNIADSTLYVMPFGVEEMFSAAYAPANTIEHVGKVSEGSYLFMKENARSVTIESEVAYIACIGRPELIADITVTL